MKNTYAVILVASLAAFGSACTQKAADDATRATDTAFDKTKAGTDKALDAVKAGTATVIDETQKAGEKSGELITDAWITTKVSAKFVDEKLLKGSNINVDTKDHVVTLKGTVGSTAARRRAEEIASGSEHVTRVINELVVK